MRTADSTSLVVLGTRPEIIKLAPVIREFERRNHEYVVCHTGQHYNPELDAVFFEQLELPEPEYNIGVGSDTHARQTASMLRHLNVVFDVERPQSCLVQGDTNSTLAGALVASKRDVSLAHLEAGLRSFDREMPEEINRVLVDHVSDHLFAPTETAAEVLYDEGIPEHRTYVTGNTIVDAVTTHARLAAEKSSILSDLDISRGEYVVLTAHRSENVDDPEAFAGILRGVGSFVERVGVECVYPVHPRAREALDANDITVPDGIRLVESLDFLDFLELEKQSALVFTDSGGVQEETCILGVPCVTVRTTTERTESIEIGANVLAGREPDSIVRAGIEMYEKDRRWPCPFGDGTAATQVVDVLANETAAEANQALERND